MGRATMTQQGKRKFYGKNRCRTNASITNISEWWLQEVEGKVPPLPNYDDRHSNAYKLDLSVGKPRHPVERRVETFDTVSSGHDLSSLNFSCIRLHHLRRFRLKPTLAGLLRMLARQ